MNANEVRAELQRLVGIISRDEYVIMDDAARCLKGFNKETDVISIYIAEPGVKDRLVNEGFEFEAVDNKSICHSFAPIQIIDLTGKYDRLPEYNILPTGHLCQRFDVVQNPDLPFPCSNYKSMLMPSINSPGAYKKLVREWISRNQSKAPIDAHDINRMMNMLRDNEPSGVREWMLSHIDKIRHMYDFSGLAFGIVIHERTEVFSIYCPGGDYNSNDNWFIMSEWAQLDLLGRLDWMYENCDFIPINIFVEHFYERGESHKWSHIKGNEFLMTSLESFLNGLEYPPKDDVYYYIKVNRNGDKYLKRDNDMSPKSSRPTKLNNQ